MIEKNGTTHDPEGDLARKYVAGTLAEDQAERFEEHYFECDECWREVETAAAVRHALTPQATARSAPRPWWPALAVAAVAAFALVGVWQWQASEPDTPIYRDAAGTIMSTNASRSADGIRITWKTPPDAQRYQVQLFKTDGELVASVVSAVPNVSFQASEIGGASQYRILAMDELGATVADSGLHPLP